MCFIVSIYFESKKNSPSNVLKGRELP